MQAEPSTPDSVFRQIVEHSADVHWLLDCASGRVLYLSPAAARHGYDLAQAQALADTLLAELPARLARHAQGDASRVRLVREHDVPLAPGADGAARTLPVDIVSTLVCDEAGVPVSLTGVVRDASERRDWAAQQKKFASMLSHEFRTPLSTIDGAIQRLDMTSAGADEATRKRYTKIQTAVDRLLAMLDEYLSPERMASIGRRRQANEVSPQALLDGAAEQARARRAAIAVHTDGLPKWMRCDPAGMRLCLDIVLDNAIKYTPPDTPIEVRGGWTAQGGLAFDVIDHGAPIADDELALLFDKGYRGRNSDGVPGSGLGLYMARAVLEVHGGTLSVENLRESGKKFRIWLPIAADAGKSLA